MSRTYRRTNSHHVYYYTTDYRYDEELRWYRRIPLEGDELQKSLARYHSDNPKGWSPAKWWRQEEWKKFRSQAKQELIRYHKNNEYEVQIRDNPRWPWWD